MRIQVTTFLFLLFLAAPIRADWPGFRGPGAQGVSAERGLPVTWSETQNVVWKLKMPGPGSSSPIVWKDSVFVTCYSGYGLVKEDKGDPKTLKRHLLCVDRQSGKVLWNKEVPAQLPEVRFSQFITEHGYASSTPATDGERVVVFFGRSGVVAFDLQGQELWQASVGTSLNGWGSAASPLLYKNLVIVNAGVESSALVALDKATGKQVWRAKGIGDCWSSPVLVDVQGKPEVVLNAQGTVYGFDPETGAKRWECDGPSLGAASSSPVSQGGIVYVMGAGSAEPPAVMAIKAGGAGDVTKTHVVWKQKGGVNHSSPVLVDDRLYWAGGQLWCAKAKSGAVLFQQRLYEGRSEYASPVAADGKIYLFTRRNGAFVVAAEDRFEQLAHNRLDDTSDFNASPAFSHGRLFVRSNETLYCLGAR